MQREKLTAEKELHTSSSTVSALLQRDDPLPAGYAQVTGTAIYARSITWVKPPCDSRPAVDGSSGKRGCTFGQGCKQS